MFDKERKSAVGEDCARWQAMLNMLRAELRRRGVRRDSRALELIEEDSYLAGCSTFK